MSDIIIMLFAPNLNLLQCLQHEIWDKVQFAMAAILKLKMAAEDVVEKNGTKVFWIQHPQIDKVSPKKKINFGTTISRDFIVASTICFRRKI